jgi:chromosome segregation ATPase
VTSESEIASQNTPEQTHELAGEHTSISETPPWRRPNTSQATANTHRDLNQIIARAREEIRHLREELTRHEAQSAHVAQERDEIQQQYTHLYENFLEAVHLAAEEDVRQAEHQLRTTPQRIPKLFESIQEAIIDWLTKQQAEREAALRQKLATVEQQAAIIRQELLHERETLNAAREKFALERQTFTMHMKTRETWLQNRWLVKAWGTAAVMFLVLPALQIYLVLQKASTWNIIIIPTAICLVLTALINLAQSRKKPASKK